MLSNASADAFLGVVAALYAKARNPLSKRIDKRVVKGRAKCVASQTEEAFADFICKSEVRRRIGYKVFVDFPITISPQTRRGKKKTRYIDFMLCRATADDEYSITYMAELKLNTGWMRNRVLKCAEEMRGLRGLLCKGEVSAREEESGLGRIKFLIEKDAPYDLIVLSGANNDLAKLKCEQTQINAKSKFSQMLILCDGGIRKGCHANRSNIKTLDKRIRERLR